MRLRSDSFDHKPGLLPTIGPISSCVMQEDMSVALEGYRGEIKIAAMLKTTEISVSSLY